LLMANLSRVCASNPRAKASAERFWLASARVSGDEQRELQRARW
jgi:hypothetical protein